MQLNTQHGLKADQVPTYSLKEKHTSKKENITGVHNFSCMALCLISKIECDYKLVPTGEWVLCLGMSENYIEWLLVNPTNI